MVLSHKLSNQEYDHYNCMDKDQLAIVPEANAEFIASTENFLDAVSLAL
ncbi:MAG: hypothetical protein ACTXOO_03730 [Sodalis sp. (in: enterobacteria)]